MTEDLKTCPFCGADAGMLMKLADTTLEHRIFTVRCRRCQCGTYWYKTSGEAFSAWNNRV